MIGFTRYSQRTCFCALLIIIFLLWLFTGGKQHDFVGIGPLQPDSKYVYNDSLYGWTIRDLERKDDIIEEILPDENESVLTIDNEIIAEPPAKFVSIGERTCRETLENLFGVPFKSTRPEWMKNPETNRRLELDCYNENLKLAVEYNGIQHYVYPNFTNQTESQFRNQVRRDQLKRELCDRKGVYLLVVPYEIKNTDIPSFILNNLPNFELEL